VKSAGGPLISLLNSGLPIRKADLYTLTLASGTVIRATSADIPVSWGGNVYPTRPLFTRTRTRTVIGVEVDTQDVAVFPQPTETLDGIEWHLACRLGALDGAWWRVDVAYFSDWSLPPVGTLSSFYGRVADVTLERSQISITVKSALELLNQQFPRNLYQVPCLHTVYDSGCNVTKASYTFSNSVTSASTPAGFTSSLAQATGYFTLGVVKFTSGANNGLTRTVKTFSGGAFTFILPLPVAAAVGDTFTATAGCDKLKATCIAKFSNQARFRGFDEIPVPETVYG
jgi:uncharacterized phage protein (TIGR02218 family)